MALPSDRPVLLHNPRCSKSRGALALLEERGVDVEVVRYLDAPPDAADLARIVDALDGEPASLVRTGEKAFAEQGLSAAELDSADRVVEILVATPRLIERPVLVVGERAVIGRPPERVLELLDD